MSHLGHFSGTGTVGWVNDRQIILADYQGKKNVLVTVYGAFLARVLARWAGGDVGSKTQTNGTSVSRSKGPTFLNNARSSARQFGFWDLADAPQPITSVFTS